MDTKHRDAYAFLNGHKLGVLSTASAEGSPDGAAIYYVVDEALNFYFLTHTGSEKYKNIQKNKIASLTVVDDYSQTTAQVKGTISEIEIGDEHDRAYQKLAHVHPPGQFAWMPPVSKLHDGSTVLMRLTPSRLRLSVFKPSETQNSAHIFDVL